MKILTGMNKRSIKVKNTSKTRKQTIKAGVIVQNMRIFLNLLELSAYWMSCFKVSNLKLMQGTSATKNGQTMVLTVIHVHITCVDRANFVNRYPSEIKSTVDRISKKKVNILSRSQFRLTFYASISYYRFAIAALFIESF